MFDRIKTDLLNLGLKFISIDEKIVRMFLETSPSNINEIVILPSVKMVMKKLISKLHNKRVHGRVYNGELNGVKVSIIRSLIGCPNCAIAVECLKRCNTKIILRVDFCGGVGNESNPIDVGDILIPKLVYCGDGTSPQYIIKSPELLSNLKKISNPISKVHEIKAGNQNIYITKPNREINEIFLSASSPNSIKEVDFWTTDALFCETSEFLQGLKTINVQGIDMENSILFLLGDIYNIKTTSILSVSDLPGHPKFDLFNANVIHPKMEKGINNAIQFVIYNLPKIKVFLK